MINNYCTTRDAAQLLGVSLRTAQNWLEKGKRSINRVPCAARSDVIGSHHAVAQPQSACSTRFQGSSAS